MKIKIESDVFDIAKRLKQINESYYILFDTSKQKIRNYIIDFIDFNNKKVYEINFYKM